MKTTDIKRFWTKVNVRKESDCWEWKTGFFDTGYGAFFLEGQNRGAHRVSLEIHLGRKLDSDEFACHTCDNPKCVNPKHLFVGTHEDNLKDMAAKKRGRNQYTGREACSKGHKYTEGSFRVSIRKNGTKETVCRECEKARGERYSKRK
jgi:hypothetical protein